MLAFTFEGPGDSWPGVSIVEYVLFDGGAGEDRVCVVVVTLQSIKNTALFLQIVFTDLESCVLPASIPFTDAEL